MNVGIGEVCVGGAFVLFVSNSNPPPHHITVPKSDFVLEAASAPSHEGEVEAETSHLDVLAAAYDASSMNVITPLAVDNAHQTLGGVQGMAVSPWVLFKLNLWRCSLQVARDKATLGLWAAVSTLIGALLGILYWQQVCMFWGELYVVVRWCWAGVVCH